MKPFGIGITPLEKDIVLLYAGSKKPGLENKDKRYRQGRKTLSKRPVG
jgi:hypothetical protein